MIDFFQVFAVLARMKILLSLLLVLVAGCASSHIITGKPRSAISPEAVKVYATMPAGAEEIAIVNGANPMALHTDSAVKMLKKQAAKLGANGIVIESAKVNGWTGSEVSAHAIFVP